MNVKFTSTLFKDLSVGDKFKRTPYRGKEAQEFVKTEKSVSMREGGVYNAIGTTGISVTKQINPQTHVYKIQEFSNKEEV